MFLLRIILPSYMGVSKKSANPKSWILIHPFWGTPIFGNTHMGMVISHDIRIPIHQPGFHEMSAKGLFHIAQMGPIFWRGSNFQIFYGKFEGSCPKIIHCLGWYHDPCGDSCLWRCRLKLMIWKKNGWRFFPAWKIDLYIFEQSFCPCV